MQLGILQCDSASEDLQSRFGDYPDMFRGLLSAADPSLSFQVYDLHREQFPEDLDECDGWLFTGSKYSVYDRAGWISRSEDLARRLHAERRPTVGICFGHQLIARALGGRVEKSAQGWGVGVHTAMLDRTDRPWMRPTTDRLSLVVSHQDQVVELPPGAQRLAGHPFCPNDMFEIDGRILTFQGHPEFTREYSRVMIERRRDQLGQDTYERGIASLEESIDAALAARWIVAFLRQAQMAA